MDQLLAGLDRDLPALACALRGTEDRQRTMQATLDWSYSLLGEQQRRLWARLSVFAGGFGEQAAAAACSGLEPLDEDLPQALAALVESSILQHEQAVRPARYSMLETVRQYGRRKLGELGEELTLQTRHRDWILQLARSAFSFDRGQLEGLQAIHRERDNIWSAMDFCRRQPGQAAAGRRSAARSPITGCPRPARGRPLVPGVAAAAGRAGHRLPGAVPDQRGPAGQRARRRGDRQGHGAGGPRHRGSAGRSRDSGLGRPRCSLPHSSSRNRMAWPTSRG